MVFKPFRTPFLKSTINHEPTNEDGQPPAKKQRVDCSDADKQPRSTAQPKPGLKFVPQKSSATIGTTQFNSPNSQSSGDAPQSYYNVLWRKMTMKKNKTWEGDGVLSIRNGFANLQDESGKELGRIAHKSAPLLEGSMLKIGGKEIEVQSMITREDYMAGRPFLGVVGKPTMSELDEKLQTSIKFNAPSKTAPSGNLTKLGKKLKAKPEASEEDSKVALPVVPLISQAAKANFKTPLLSNTVLPQGNGEKPVPRHDPTAPDAIVMKRPQYAPKGKQIVDVVIDPILSQNLRDHQREGVKFLYECVMGMRPDSGIGAVLADEMGLGKTLQVIALLWTLLKQNPIYNEKPVIRKALIVCPVTLITNWKKEFRKWLGYERLGVFIVDDDKTRISDFTKGRSYNVMIIGYERLRNVQEDLRKGAGIDIVIADEGHRLKTAKNKSAEAIKSLQTERRIILSGTPLQNDLSEFYFMVDFVNPGLLGKMNAFKREFEAPILKSRLPGATRDVIEKGEARSHELARLTSNFIIRRTAEILSKYLPPKTEYVLFCKPTAVQTAVYRKVLASPVFGTALGSSEGRLQLITILKKVCNSPSLLQAKEESEERTNPTAATLLSSMSDSLLRSPGASGKLQVLDGLLHRIRTTSQEKVVIVSHYTTTLDLIAKLLTALSYKHLRLDGKTPPSKRQNVVDLFNRTDASTHFAFLLSAKSGGVGLNLIGASRLILFDVDWNPSTELQAMARIHRDGQKRPCWIYRFLTQGALDEKIYQRQATKLSLADAVIDNKESKGNFSPEELRDLFSLDEESACQTHSLLRCSCQGRGRTVVAGSPAAKDDIDSSDGEDLQLNYIPKLMKAPTQADVDAAEHFSKAKDRPENDMSALMRYQHLDTSLLVTNTVNSVNAEDPDDDLEMVVEDDVLRDMLKDGENRVSFVFVKTST